MWKVTKLTGVLALILFSQWPATSLAGHPLLMEDTGTQGTGRCQLELTNDLGHTRNEVTNTRDQSINVVISVGLTDSLDVIASLPYERLIERMGTQDATVHGYADSEIAAKWRFYEEGELSFALRPGLGLPTGNADKGLSMGHATPKLFVVMTYASDPWAFYLHFGYTRNFHNGPDERNHIYHASVAAEYNVSESVRLVSDASIEGNTEQSGHPNVGSMVLGLVYPVTPNLDVDLGYRKA